MHLLFALRPRSLPVLPLSSSLIAPAFRGRAEVTWRRERQDRTRLVNKVLKHYGLSLVLGGGERRRHPHPGYGPFAEGAQIFNPQAGP